jgi:hypothetical protein
MVEAYIIYLEKSSSMFDISRKVGGLQKACWAGNHIETVLVLWRDDPFLPVLSATALVTGIYRGYSFYHSSPD